MATEAEWAWAAGFWVGDGSISFHGRSIKLVASQCEKDVLLRFKAIVGCGSIYVSTQSNTRWAKRPVYHWGSYRGPDVLAILTMFAPWLDTRRKAQVARAVNAYLSRPLFRGRLCKRGHPLSDAYVDHRGRRSCRVCVLARSARRYHERKLHVI